MAAVNNLELIWHVDIFLLATLAVVTAFTIPRAIARFSSLSEWGQGLILRSVDLSNDIPRRRRKVAKSRRRAEIAEKSTSPAVSKNSSVGLVGSEEAQPSTLASHGRRTNDPRLHRSEVISYSLPPHMPMWSSFSQRVSSFFLRPITGGLCLGQMLVLFGYAILIVYASFYRSSPFTDPIRTGYVALSQMPVLYLLGAKNNMIGLLAGVGYEKLNYIHRFAGWLLFTAVQIHTLGYVYKWSLAGDFTVQIAKPSHAWGMVGTVCVYLLSLPAIPAFREKLFNVFHYFHLLGYIVMLVAIPLHVPNTIPYILASASSVIFDHTLRILKTRITSANIDPVPELAVSYISIPSINAGWRAGQHVRLRVLERDYMGRWLGWTESHPFTISNGPRDQSGDGLVLMCARAGDWTTRLFDLANVASYEGSPGVRVSVEGPYGGTGHTLFASYSAAMLVAGGSGITFGLSSVQNLVQNEIQGRSRLRLIELVWIIQDSASLTPFLPFFDDLINRCPRPLLSVSVFYTRAPSQPPSLSRLPPGVTLSPGRPNLGKMLKAVVEQTRSLSTLGDGHRLCGVTVGVCGPHGLSDDVQKAAQAIDKNLRRAVGGIEVHEEVF